MVARKELETIMKRYRDSDNNQKMSTPSGFGVFIIYFYIVLRNRNLIYFSRS